MYYVTPPLPALLPQARQWSQRYRARTGSDPTAFSLLGYDAVMVAVDAVRRAHGTDPAAVLRELRTTRLTTPSGTVTFDERQVASTGFQLVTIRREAYALACSPTCS